MTFQGLSTTNYSGEVLEHILTIAATSNELVEKGLIMVIPQVEHKLHIPRVRANQMLQKRVEKPAEADSKGELTWSEKTLEPRDMMVYTEFNPRVFEHIWREWQPTGNLVFRELPANIQVLLFNEVLKRVSQEMGWHFINGTYEAGTDRMKLMDGILTQAAKDADVVKVSTIATTVTGRLKELKRRIPVTMRRDPNLRILMSVEDFDTYDDELTARESKNADETNVNRRRYKGIAIEDLTDWPQGLIVATLCSSGTEGNLFAAVNMANDANVVQIDKTANADETYFIKMLMTGDTNIGFGEYFIALDWREDGAFVAHDISAKPNELEFAAAGGSQNVAVTATGDYTIGAAPTGFTAVKNDNTVTITAAANDGVQRDGTITLTLAGHPEVTAEIDVIQEAEG
jgi:hypothetical protein